VKIQIQKAIMDMTGMMPGPDGNTAMPMEPTPMGDGDVLGDAMSGPETPENIEDPANQAMRGTQQMAEAEIRNKLVTDAYGTKLPQRRAVDKE
jgi:hypothetical protein